MSRNFAENTNVSILYNKIFNLIYNQKRTLKLDCLQINFETTKKILIMHWSQRVGETGVLILRD